MNTNKTKIRSKNIGSMAKTASMAPTDSHIDPLVEMVDTIKSVKTTGKQAKENSISMDDNNGFKVFYNMIRRLSGRKR